MRILRGIGAFIWRFMVIFSFIINIVLVVVVIGLAVLIFDIKNNIVTPLVAGLHSSFVGLDEATIDWTIPVRDTIPVAFDLPLDQNTVVILTENVPLTVFASISAPPLELSSATVSLTLPAGTRLPVALDLMVPVSTEIDVSLDVRAIIPLNQTQLHDPFENLRLVFEPITRGLYNLPNDYNAAGQLVADILNGTPAPNFLAENAYSRDPWIGFSRSAGVNYDLQGVPIPPENVPRMTGIIPQGGIPALDEQIRADVYAAGGPDTVNAAAQAVLPTTIAPLPFTYNDGMVPGDLGILPTPANP
ncbi:MAG: hypothetical protein SGJ24_05575 [Chloroflexota bacterium]|nr:hypothetical protein [Chloroflexota bacterium]